MFKPKLRHVCRQTTSLVPGLEVPRALWASESDRLWSGSTLAPATYNWDSVFVVSGVLPPDGVCKTVPIITINPNSPIIKQPLKLMIKNIPF